VRGWRAGAAGDGRCVWVCRPTASSASCTSRCLPRAAAVVDFRSRRVILTLPAEVVGRPRGPRLSVGLVGCGPRVGRVKGPAEGEPAPGLVPDPPRSGGSNPILATHTTPSCSSVPRKRGGTMLRRATAAGRGRREKRPFKHAAPAAGRAGRRRSSFGAVGADRFCSMTRATAAPDGLSDGFTTLGLLAARASSTEVGALACDPERPCLRAPCAPFDPSSDRGGSGIRD
jgi:hypothetical protein